MAFATIQPLIQGELGAMDSCIRRHISVDIPLVESLYRHVITDGKRIRPVLVFLIAKALNETVSPDGVRLASAIELFHTASLLHDDVIDESELRRGKKAARMVFGNSASVLMGDYFYASASQLVAGLEYPDVMHIMTDAFRKIVEGEVLQLSNVNNFNCSETDYYTVIEAKTAQLFEVGCRLSAVVHGKSPMIIEAARKYGHHVGMAFQLADDVIDYQSSAGEMGKAAGDDLSEGKMTLPLIYARDKASRGGQKILKKAIETGDRQALADVKAILLETGAIDYTLAGAKRHIDRAVSGLSVFPSSSYIEALIEIANLAVNRSA